MISSAPGLKERFLRWSVWLFLLLIRRLFRHRSVWYVSSTTYLLFLLWILSRLINMIPTVLIVLQVLRLHL
jgi:hypothetical protein